MLPILFSSMTLVSAMALLLSQALASDILIEGIRVVDGDGDRGIHDLLILGDRIAAIDPTEIPEGITRYEGDGKSILPGLIDSHIHITMIPGEPFRNDSAEQRKKRHATDLRSYLAWGITSVVDPGITVEDVNLIRGISKESPAPELYLIGPILGPTHGYPSIITKFEGISSPEEVTHKIDEYRELNPLGIKITMENGHFGPIWPLHSREMLDFIQSECNRRDIRMYIHAMDAKMTRKALKMKPHALVHASKNGGKSLAREIAAQDVYVVTTLDIYGSPLIQWDRELLSHPNIGFTVPREAIELIYDKDVMRKSKETFLRVNIPWMPLWLAKLGMNKRSVRSMLRKASSMIRTLDENGVKLVLGSDSGGWPILTYMLHGPTTHLEIDLLSEAGLSPQTIIASATKLPAEMLGISKEVGGIQVGLRADLLIVEGNPLEDITRLHNPVWVIRKGELRTPRGWMED